MAETRSEQERPDTKGAFYGVLVLAAIFYFAVVFWQLPDRSRLWITLGTAVAFALLALAVHFSRTIAAFLRRIGIVAYDFLVFVLVVVVVVVVPISLDRADRIVLLKAAAVVYFSLLPALLYLQFSSRKTLAVWKDFVVNLYKLKADNPGNLPRPPTLSPFYEGWKDARDAAWTKSVLVRGPKDSRADVEDRLEQANQYRIKFRDLFGRIPSATEPASVLSIRSTHKLQVVMATALITLGWVFVVQPEDVFGQQVFPKVTLNNLPDVPEKSLAFGFLGAYFYILQMLVRRYFQNDLKSTAYINATMRLVIVILLVLAVDPLLSKYFDASQATLSAVAFVIGVFPSVGWQFLQQALIRKPIGVVVDSLEPKHKLGDLDGLNIWYESRLLEVGVEDMQNLATTDIVDLMLNTRIPVDRIVDWIDQALLYLRVVAKPQRELLRGYGIRSATDLEDALDDTTVGPAIDRLLNVVFDEHGQIVYDAGAPKDDGLPSRVLALRVTLQTERNLQHVRAWKAYCVAEAERTAADAEHAEEAGEQPPPAAAAPQPA